MCVTKDAMNAKRLLMLVSLMAQPVFGQFIAADIGTLGGHSAAANALNGKGQVVGGSFTTNDAEYHAFFWDGAKMSDLGTLGGTNSTATGINDSGLIVGYSLTSNNVFHAFCYSNGIMKDLGTLGGPQSFALGVNQNGQITGFADLADSDQHHGFVYANGQMIDINPGGNTSSEGAAINNAGQVAGTIYRTANNDDNRDALLFSDGVITNLGTLGGRNSTASGINSSGIVVGSSDNPDNSSDHIIVYRNGTLIDLGVPLGGVNANAFGINSAGQIVGYSAITGGPPHALFSPTNGSFIDLNSAIRPPSIGSLLWSAMAINDSGQIVAQVADGHSYLLTPVPTLSIALGVRVSWPSPSSGFVLQQNTAISGTNWVNYTGTVFDDGTNKSAFLTPALDQSFFRLVAP